MNTLTILSAVIGCALYFPLCRGIYKKTIEQSFATWFLWTLLDAIAAITLIIQDGNFLLPAAYTAGSLVVSAFIFRSGNFSWTKFESFVCVLVAICVTVWAISGPKIATIASSLALVLAGIPQLLDAYRKPWESPAHIYFGYFVANSLAVLAAKNWSVEERFYPASCTVYTLIVTALVARKYFMNRPDSPPYPKPIGKCEFSGKLYPVS